MNTSVINKLSKLLKKNSQSKYYYPRNYHYESLYENYKNLSEYFNLLLSVTRMSLSTDESIKLIKEKAFNIGKNEIVKQFKKPQAKFEIHMEGLAIDIFIYKIVLGDYPARLEIHMNKGFLFYYNYKLSVNSQGKQKIIQIIQDKYLNGSPIDVKNQNIVDKNQKILQIENEDYLRIHYIDIGSIAFEEIRNCRAYYEKRNEHKTKMKQRELRERL